jgi:hypothetical protein
MENLPDNTRPNPLANMSPARARAAFLTGIALAELDRETRDAREAPDDKAKQEAVEKRLQQVQQLSAAILRADERSD